MVKYLSMVGPGSSSPQTPLTLGETVDHVRSLATFQNHPAPVPGHLDLLSDLAFCSNTRTRHYKSPDAIWTITAPEGPEDSLIIAVHDRPTFDPAEHDTEMPIGLYRFTKAHQSMLVDMTTATIERTTSDFAKPEFALTCRGLAKLLPRNDAMTFHYFEDTPLDEVIPFIGNPLSRAAELRPVDGYVSVDASQDEVMRGQFGATELREVIAAVLGDSIGNGLVEARTSGKGNGLTLATYSVNVPFRNTVHALLGQTIGLPDDYRPVEDSFPEADFAIIVDRPTDPHVVYLRSKPATAMRISFQHTDQAPMDASLFNLQFLHNANLAGRMEALSDDQIRPYIDELVSVT
jgi:hypothetical protein